MSDGHSGLGGQMAVVSDDGTLRQPRASDFPDDVLDGGKDSATNETDLKIIMSNDDNPVSDLTVDAVRRYNDAVDERITELERKISRLHAKAYTDEPADDGDDPESDVFDLRQETASDD